MLKAKVINGVHTDNPALLEILLSDKEAAAEYFKDIKGAKVFLKNKFLMMVSDKNFLLDSYTAYKNKIGLMDNEGLIKEKGEVVLNFPFKDCLLEGGQTQESDKRRELFFNETLAKDEIDRLLSPKAFVNAKRITAKGEKPLKNFNRDERQYNINDNLLIKGNNLLALHSLKKRFASKVKLIYIDPPYNTGSDSFGYNDSFNHSSWLVFMKNRLEIARELLREDGVIFVHIDNTFNKITHHSPEYAYLIILLDEIFGRENFINNIIWKKVQSTKKQSSYLSSVTENIIAYRKSENFSLNKLFIEAELEKDLKNYPYTEEGTGRRYGSFDFTQKGQGEARIFNGKKLEPPSKKHWIWAQEKIDEGLKKGLIIFTSSGTPRVKRYLDDKEGNPLTDLWADDGVKIISANDCERQNFEGGQKPEALLKRILSISTQPSDLVLDFFAGCGTTAAVAHKMGRQWITIEQMDYIDTITKERLKKVLDGEQCGISKAQNWQGGGDFVYLELAPFNEVYKQKVKACKDSPNLLKVYEEIKEGAFLDYRYDLIKELKGDKDFASLDFTSQKKILVDILDKNQMYLPYTEIEDASYKISKNDIERTLEFYGGY